MNEVTRILSAIEKGDPRAAEQLLPLVYDELRRVAAEKMAREKPGQTLQPTALVHEAYLRLVAPSQSASQAGQKETVHWDSRRHFFAAAAEAMRRILVEQARRKGTAKRGGGRARMALDEALQALERHDSQAADLVKLRYFGGLGHQEAAQTLGISRRAADRLWVIARAWLYRHLAES
jgi:DNA-directed RNA polymerase specialized sigma24 family protein